MSKTDQTVHPVHPLKTEAKVLLSSVFGPYAQDDEYGSRKINPMELFHNQVTRVQGVFSFRMFHRSWGLMLLKENIEAPCVLLDYPTLDRFIQEIRGNRYDVIGISAILPNISKVKKMCKEIRHYLPNAKIIVGGHITSLIDLGKRIDVDHITRDDGIKWFRKYLGQDENAPVKHPAFKIVSGVRAFGIHLSQEEDAAVVMPSVGCPVGCNFCCTSHMFGGKGKFVNFYETGDELFSVMCDIEKKLQLQVFHIIDENFLLHRKRALRLLELIEQHNKSWTLRIFSSANVLNSYSMEQLVRLGIFCVWIGFEGRDSQYAKLEEINSQKFVKYLQSHGIIVLGSTIIGLEDHTPDNIDKFIDWTVNHEAVFHQFMLYMPGPGTPFYEEQMKKGTLFSENEFKFADWHGQYRFNYCHEHIPPGQETELLVRAFERDFEVNGPSVIRAIEITLKGWKRYKNHPNRFVKKRFKRQIRNTPILNSAAVWATRKWYKENERMYKKIDALFQEIYSEFGWKSKIAAPLLGRIVYFAMKMEDKRLNNGWTYEPPTFYEKNEAAKKLQSNKRVCIKR